MDEFNFENPGTCQTRDGAVFTHLVTPEYVDEDPAVEYFFDESGSLVAVRALVEGDAGADAWCCGGFPVSEIWYGEPLAIMSCEDQPG